MFALGFSKCVVDLVMLIISDFYSCMIILDLVYIFGSRLVVIVMF